MYTFDLCKANSKSTEHGQEPLCQDNAEESAEKGRRKIDKEKTKQGKLTQEPKQRGRPRKVPTKPADEAEPSQPGQTAAKAPLRRLRPFKLKPGSKRMKKESACADPEGKLEVAEQAESANQEDKPLHKEDASQVVQNKAPLRKPQRKVVDKNPKRAQQMAKAQTCKTVPPFKDKENMPTDQDSQGKEDEADAIAKNSHKTQETAENATEKDMDDKPVTPKNQKTQRMETATSSKDTPVRNMCKNQETKNVESASVNKEDMRDEQVTNTHKKQETKLVEDAAVNTREAAHEAGDHV